MRSSFPAAVVVAVVACAALASCSSDSDSDPEGGSGSGSGGAGAESSASETDEDGAGAPEEETGDGDGEGDGEEAAPPPSGPCAEGSCEVEVVVGDVLEVPESYGLGPIEVTGIAGDTVDMVAPVTGSGFSLAGCSGGGGVTSHGGGGVGMSCDVGTAATVNDAMGLEVVEITGDGAVLRIEPAG